MAGQPTNAFETYDAVGNREELSDTIWKITPEETPFLSLIGKKKVKTTHPEWQTDELAAPVNDNAVVEGNDWAYDAVVPTVRPGNYTQISEKSFIITKTQEETDKAGRKSEVARETSKKGVELRTDLEVQTLSNAASSAGSGDGASTRVSGGMRAWLATNTNVGATGADGGFNTGTGVVDAATPGTKRAFTKALLDDVILKTYNSGGNPNSMIMSPYAKTVFSTFMSDTNVAQFRYSAKKNPKNVIIASAEIYLSDFGEVAMIPNRQMARHGADTATNAFLIDPKMVSLGEFRPIRVHKAAMVGDNERRVLNTEYTLCVHNEQAHGVVADIYGMNATT